LFDKVGNWVDSLDIWCFNDERSFPEHLFEMGGNVGTNRKGAPTGNVINLPSIPVGGAITMTATLYTTSTTGAAWETRGSRVPNYHLRRTVAAFIIAFIVLLAAIASVTVVGALTGLGGRPAAASETLPASAPVAASSSIHVAEPGDSLWSIADFYRSDIGRDRYIDALISLNGGTAIQAGQAVHLP
jgi:LysM repeat protein